MSVQRYLFSNAFFSSNHVNCCHLVARLLLIVSLGWGSNSVLAGTSSSYEIGKQPLHTHPIDILVREKVKNWSDSNFTFRVSNLSGYSTYNPMFVHGISVYSSLKRTSLHEVEQDLSDIIEKIITLYNSIQQIRPYLAVFPINVQDVRFHINYGPIPEELYRLPYFCCARVTPHNSEVEIKQWKNAKAFSISQQQGVIKKTLDIPSIASLRNSSTRREKKRIVKPINMKDELEKSSGRWPFKYLYRVIDQLCGLYQLNCSALQDCALGWNSHKSISAGFWTPNKEMKLEEARQFCDDFIETYLREIRKNKVIEKSYRKDSEAFKDFNENLNWFCFRITFWDEYLNRVEEPYIAQIQCQDGKIMYFTADEGQRLQQVFEEPVPERFFPNIKSL